MLEQCAERFGNWSAAALFAVIGAGGECTGTREAFL
jgi:hypothetical protein